MVSCTVLYLHGRVVVETPVLKNTVFRLPHRRSMWLAAASKENPRRWEGELRRPSSVDAEQNTQLGGVVEVRFGRDSSIRHGMYLPNIYEQ